MLLVKPAEQPGAVSVLPAVNLADCGVFVVQIDGETHVLHTEEAAQGTRLVVDTLSCLIAKEADPSRIIAQVGSFWHGRSVSRRLIRHACLS